MINKYVLAGGPSSGKTAGIEYLKVSLGAKGYKVYTIQETASELIRSGLDRTSPNFPYYNYSLMVYKELLIEKNAKQNREDSIILCDRGRMDAKAYRGEKIFNDILSKYPGTTEKSILDSYDAVLFMQSVADGMDNCYLKDEIRTEDILEAKIIQNKLFDVWKEHKKIVFVPNCEKLQDKLKTLEMEIIKDVEKRKNQCLTSEELIRFSEGINISKEKMFEQVEALLKSVNPEFVRNDKVTFEH